MRSLTPIPIMTIVVMAVLASHVAVAVTVVTINLTSTGVNDYTLAPVNDTTILFYYAPVTFGVSPIIEGYYINVGNCQFTQAPAPQVVNAAEPELVRLQNGTLALMWLRVYGKYPNVSILIQESVLSNGQWGSPINITHNGVIASYTSDGEYIYIVHEPEPSLSYSNTQVIVTTMNGAVVKVYNIPFVIGIDAYNMTGVLLLANGSKALINFMNGTIKPADGIWITRNGGYFSYNPYTHIVTINGLHATIPGNYTDAYPIPFNNGYIIVAWGSIVSAFKWVGGSLTPLANLTGVGNWEYLEVDGVVTGDTAVIAFLNTYNMRLYVSIIPLNGECTPSGISGAVTTTVAPVTTTTTTATVTVGNTTTVTRTATVYVNTTVTVPVNRTVTATVVRYLTMTVTARASGSSVPLIMVIVIVAIVAAVTFLVTRRHYAWL
jgi:hypothetical protein